MADFKLGFSLNTSELEKGKKALHEVADAAGNLVTAEGRRKAAHDTADAALNKTITASKQAEASAQRYIQSLRMEEQATKAFESAQKSLNAALDQGKLSAQQHANYIKQVGAAYADAKRQAEAFRTAQPTQQPGAGFAGTLERLRGLGDEAGNLGGILTGRAGVGGAMEGIAGMATRLGAALGPVGIGLAAVAATAAAAGVAFNTMILPLAQVQDRFTAYQARINLVLKDQDAAAASMARVIDSANEAGVSLDSALGGFERILRNKDSLAVSTEEIETLMSTVQKLGAISNTSGGEMQGAMIQFSQAIASGRLNGDELRSIMESMPSLAKAIADGLGVGVGELRRMGAEGQLTGDKVFKALLSQTDKVREDFEKLPDTTERAMNRMANQWDMLKAKIAEALNASAIAQGIIGIGERALEAANNAFEDPTVSEELTAKTKQLAAAKAALADEQERYNRALAAGQDVRFMEGGINARTRGIERLKKELEALQAAAKDDAAKKATEDAALADQQRQKSITDAVNAVKAAGYDKQQQEVNRLTKEHENFTAKLKEAQAAREELRKKNIDAATAEMTAFSLVTVAIAKMQAAMASGNPFRIAAAQTEVLVAKGNAATATANREKLKGELPQADENVRVIEQGVQEALADLRKARTGGGSRGGGASSVSQIEQLRRTVGDLRKAVEGGEFGGGIEFATQAAAAERDKKGTGTETRKLLEEQRSLQATQQIAQLERQAKQQDALTAAMGKSRLEIREVEIAQKALNYEIETFGKANSPAAIKAVADYTAALRRQAEAADRAAAAQKILAAQQQAALSAALLAAAPDARSQDVVKFEAQLKTELDSVADPAQRAALEKSRREEFANQQLLSQRQMVRSQEEEMRFIEERFKLAGLTSSEYEIQLRLLQRRRELEAQGIDTKSGFGAEQMVREEANARREQVITEEETRKRNFIRKWEGTADRVGDLLSNSFDVAFDRGLKTAGGTFLKGMGGIFKELGNDMVYQLAIRPVQELIRGLMQMAAQKILTSIIGGVFGGGLPGASAGSVTGSSGGWAVPIGGGPTGFANGGVFTNRIVSSPTIFAFAGGTGLMGEAGPEAILPLKRGANGKLGVEAGGSDGGTTVVINDMRSGSNAERVQTQERRGPDGKRMISVLIRDEVRRQIRSGDLDREMQASYGANRQLARK
jgi:lambda family phage tail tape measure protein